MAVLGLAFAVLASACSSGGAEEADPDPVVTLPDDPVTGGDGGGDDGGEPGRTPTGSGGGGTSTTASERSTTTGRSGTTATTARQSTTTTRSSSSPVDPGAKDGVGGYARHLLRPQGARSIVVEPLVQPGAAPLQSTLDKIARVLRDASGKPVSVAPAVALPAGDGTTDDTEIRDWSDRYGRTAQTDEQAVLRLLFLNGRFEDTASVLGVAVRGDTAAVFKERVRESANPPLVTVAQVEDAVTTHEFGHLLGLVDLVVDTGRDDPKSPGHSTNRDSVMYSEVESHPIGQVLNGPPPKEFDAEDRDDLAALRSS